MTDENVNPFADVTDEDLQASFDTKKGEFDTLVALEEPTVEQVETAKALRAELRGIKAEQASRDGKVEQAAADFAELKNENFDADTEGGDGDETADDEDADKDKESEGDEPAGDESEAGEGVEAAADDKDDKKKDEPKKPPFSARKIAAAKIGRPAAPDLEPEGSPVSLVAAAGVDGYETGQSLSNLLEVGQAVVARTKGFPGVQLAETPAGYERPPAQWSDRHAVAKIEVPFESDFVIDSRSSEDTMMEVMKRASDEWRLKADDGEEGLVAAGGWCSPSETLYDLAADESLDGILSLPEVQVKRGGIRYTEGPQFVDFYANAGFIQTEAQAIAGNTKPFYSVECPDFTEVRLDAVGVGIEVPILTQAAYPELVNRFTSGTLIAHEHMVNANVIGRMVALSGAARVIAGLGATTTDAMEGLALVANQRRQSQRLAFNRTMEVVVPFWVKEMFRTDLERRNGVTGAVADSIIDEFFRVRSLVVSWVYDWQPIDETAEVYPATYNVLVYPAGTFIKGVSQVINLSTVYDKASLEVNMYTALFMEQGLLVAKMQYGSDLLTLPVENVGRTGRTDLGAANA